MLTIVGVLVLPWRAFAVRGGNSVLHVCSSTCGFVCAHEETTRIATTGSSNQVAVGGVVRGAAAFVALFSSGFEVQKYGKQILETFRTLSRGTDEGIDIHMRGGSRSRNLVGVVGAWLKGSKLSICSTDIEQNTLFIDSQTGVAREYDHTEGHSLCFDEKRTLEFEWPLVVYQFNGARYVPGYMMPLWRVTLEG